MTLLDPPVELVARPAPANPPLAIAVAITLAGLVGPFVFLRARNGSPLLGIASLALGAAGIIAMAGAVRARSIRRTDLDYRVRASIATHGVTIFKAPPPAGGLHFPTNQIAGLRLLPGTLIIYATQAHPSPGRHAIRFGKMIGDPGTIAAAIEILKRPQ
jgi:hypothetical protein